MTRVLWRSKPNAGIILPTWSNPMTRVLWRSNPNAGILLPPWSSLTAEIKSKRLAPYCHNPIEPNYLPCQFDSQTGAGTVLPPLIEPCSKDSTAEIKYAGTILLHTKLPTLLIRFSVGESHQCQINYLSIWLVNYEFDNQFNPPTQTDRSQVQPVTSGGWGSWMK